MNFRIKLIVDTVIFRGEISGLLVCNLSLTFNKKQQTSRNKITETTLLK